MRPIRDRGVAKPYGCGSDTGSFGSLQALPSFLTKFGTYNAATKKYALPSNVASAMNAIYFAGQALGALLSIFAVDWFGYKITMVILALIQIIAVISMSAQVQRFHVVVSLTMTTS